MDDVLDMVGSEVSVALPSSRARRRGFVTEVGSNGLPLVSFYDRQAPFEVEIETEKLRILSDRQPAGWKAIDVVDHDGALLFSMRLNREIYQMLKQIARERGVSFEEAFNYAISLGTEIVLSRMSA